MYLKKWTLGLKPKKHKMVSHGKKRSSMTSLLYSLYSHFCFFCIFFLIRVFKVEKHTEKTYLLPRRNKKLFWFFDLKRPNSTSTSFYNGYLILEYFTFFSILLSRFRNRNAVPQKKWNAPNFFVPNRNIST